MYSIKKYIKPYSEVLSLYKPFLITSLGVKMRNPFTTDGLWRGWTDEEVANHLQSVRSYIKVSEYKKKQSHHSSSPYCSSDSP
jgi:hypothetical protein